VLSARARDEAASNTRPMAPDFICNSLFKNLTMGGNSLILTLR